MATDKSPVWFITAASSGFGREIAFEALKRGHTVVATARDPARIQDLADAGAQTLAFDVTSPPSTIEAVVKDVFAKHNRVDYLINAAGYILDGAIEELTPEEMYDSFNTNVFGAVNTVRAFLPNLRAQSVAANGTRATVAVFGSVGSWRGGATWASYAMTKWSASALAESLYPELQPFSIVATVIEPGYFRTGFLNPNARMLSKLRLDAYEDENTPSGKTRRAFTATDGNQPGDVKKGANVIVDILTKTGVGSGRDVPMRIVLGSDAEQMIRAKLAETTKLLDEWSDVIRSTDHTKE